MRLLGKRALGTIFLSSLAGSTLAAEVTVETRLVPDVGIRSGQPVSYEVDVLTDTWLTGTPEFRPLQVAGALASFEGSQGRSIQRTIGGKRYFGVTYSYRLIPLEPGVTILPSFKIQAPVGQEKHPVTLTVPERSFAVQPLPAAESADISFLAADVRLSQSISPTTANVAAGQPIVREIRVRAEQALALSIPPMTPSSSGHMQGTPLPADIRPIIGEGGWIIGGERIERIRYSPEQAGRYTLPGLSVTWWDIDDDRVRQTTLPALPIEVLPGPGPSQTGTPWRWLIVLLAIGVSTSVLVGYWQAITLRVTNVIGRIRNCWQDSLPGRKRTAIRQLKGTPRELTGVYRLVQGRSGAHSLRYAPLAPRQREALLAAIAGYYSARPQPESSTQKLILQIHNVKGDAVTGQSRQTAQLPPLNPNER